MLYIRKPNNKSNFDTEAVKLRSTLRLFHMRFNAVTNRDRKDVLPEIQAESVLQMEKWILEVSERVKP